MTYLTSRRVQRPERIKFEQNECTFNLEPSFFFPREEDVVRNEMRARRLSLTNNVRLSISFSLKTSIRSGCCFERTENA